MDDARNCGISIVTIPENLRAKVANTVDVSGNRIVDITAYTQSYNKSFIFEFVEPESLSEEEKDVFSITPWILEKFGGKPENVKGIRISSTMRPDTNSIKKQPDAGIKTLRRSLYGAMSLDQKADSHPF